MALFQARLSRPRPHLDDKVLTGWNGLMLAAFARAGRVLPGERCESALSGGRRAVGGFPRNPHVGCRPEVLKRRYRDGDAAIDGYAEDYAYLIFGLLELFQADGDPHWLAWARTLQQRQDEQFWDAENGGWFNTTGVDPSVILRMKEDYDGAEPSPSSISVLNLLMLAHLTGEAELFERIDKTLKMFGPRIGQVARAVPMMMAALSTYHAKVAQVVIVGLARGSGTKDLMRELTAEIRSVCVIVPVEPGARQSSLPACCRSSARWRCATAMRRRTCVTTSRALSQPPMQLDSPSGSPVRSDARNGTQVDVWLRGTDFAKTQIISGIGVDAGSVDRSRGVEAAESDAAGDSSREESRLNRHSSVPPGIQLDRKSVRGERGCGGDRNSSRRCRGRSVSYRQEAARRHDLPRDRAAGCCIAHDFNSLDLENLLVLQHRGTACVLRFGSSGPSCSPSLCVTRQRGQRGSSVSARAALNAGASACR